MPNGRRLKPLTADLVGLSHDEKDKIILQLRREVMILENALNDADAFRGDEQVPMRTDDGTLVPALEAKALRLRVILHDRYRAGVYFIQHPDGLFKIGHSRSLSARLYALQMASAVPLILAGWIPTADSAGSVQLESAAHDTFAAHRVSGEWFQLSPLAVRQYVEEHEGLWEPRLE